MQLYITLMKSKRNPRGTEKMQAKGQKMYDKGVNTLKKNYNDTFSNYFGYKIESAEDTITEGYESKVIEICKAAGVDCSFKDGKMYVAKEDMAKAKKALEDNEDILELPEMVAENAELDRLKQLIGVDSIREMKQ